MKSITYSFEYYPDNEDFIEEQIELNSPSYIPLIGEWVSFSEDFLFVEIGGDVTDKITSFEWIVTSRFFIPDEDRMFITLGINTKI